MITSNGKPFAEAVLEQTCVVTRSEETLGQIAAKDFRKVQIFKKYDLDFCCGGKKTLKQACIEKGLDLRKMENELEHINESYVTRPLPYDEWNLDFLCDYIINTHHSYVKKMMPEITVYAAKVTDAHGSRHPELSLIQNLFEQVRTELTTHLQKEETMLFPYIKELATKPKSCERSTSTQLHNVKDSISMMEKEHEFAGMNLEAIRSLSNNFELPEDVCDSYRLLFNMLEEFENDLHLHVHLENNILFPKALMMERSQNHEAAGHF